MGMCTVKASVSSARLGMTHNAMISKDSIETAYSFIHQKHRVYIHSQMDWQRDDIEYAIASYVDSMNKALYDRLSQGREDFLRNHAHFEDELTEALQQLEEML